MTDFYDHLETRDPNERRVDQVRAVSEQVAHAQATCPAWTNILQGIEAAKITSVESIAE